MKLQNTFHYALGFVFLTIALILTGCSTQKNTAQSRWWHAFNAKYNTYYNGTLAYIDASLEKEAGNKDNYTEQIPLYTVTNKSSREIGKSNYDRAIEKCEKAIHQHSIKSRPEWTKSRKKTEKDIEWLAEHIDFSLQTKRPDMDAVLPLLQKEDAAYDALLEADNPFAQDSYWKLWKVLGAVKEYTLMDLDGDGVYALSQFDESPSTG